MRVCLSTLWLLCTLSACGQIFEKPRIHVQRVDITTVNFAGIAANVVFAVENPNVIGVDLARFGYQLTVDGHAFVQGNNSHTLHVPARGHGELQVPIGFKFVELAQALDALFTKREVPFTISAKLGFGSPLGVIDIPLSHSGTFPVPQLPTVLLGEARVASADLTGATLSATIKIRNRNAYALPIGALKAGVQVNGVSLANVSSPARQLAADGTVPVVISTRLEYLRAGLGIAKAVQSHSATVRFDGSLDLLGYTLPVRLQTTLR